MLHLTLLLHLLLLSLSAADEATGFGPVFEEQPVETIYPEESPEARITLNCRARANPPATYMWKHNNMVIDLNEEGSQYSLAGGNLVISNPIKTKHEGHYSCMASNMFGTVVSQKNSVQFGYLDLFSSEERETVKVKEGQGAVLLCAPPPHHSAELSFRWILNEFPTFIPLDKRRFVSQSNGNLYISKVDSSDTGNYSCIASSPSISKSVFSNYIPLVPLAERPIRKYPADLNVKFPDTTALVGQNITLECFALGNPVPEIHWKKLEGSLPPNHEVRMAGSHLHLYNVQFEDGGTYQCEAVNSRGKDYHTGRVLVEAFPEWVEHISSTEKDLGSQYTMSCSASGKPKPHVHWLKNGEPLDKKEIKFSSLRFDDSGMYQCIAENHHGVIYANAELRVFACAPTFEHNPVKRVLAAKNGRVVIECGPKAAPKPHISWSRDTELFSNSTRVFIWEDGSLEILNVTQADEGSYTCFAENDRGKANSTGTLLVTDSTKITLAPSNVDVKVGENAWMQCAASYDSSLDITFIWSLDGRVIDLHKESQHYERTPNGSSIGELLIKKAQLKHAGRYSCTAQTTVDNITASAHLVVRGPPGAPGGVRVVNKTENSVTLHWSRGADNHSPISKYTIQLRNSLTNDAWKIASTSPADIEGNKEAATVVDLFPWTEYEFRVTATNTLGTGEPSGPSPKERTMEAIPVVVPSDIGGGGGTSRELTITWTPVQPEYYYGPNFGYIVAFKPQDDYQWRTIVVADPQAGRYIHKESSVPPLTKFQVKVKAFNSQGEGPYSVTAIVLSAQDAPSEAPGSVKGKALSATDASVWWLPLLQTNIDGYQVKYWRSQEEGEAGAQRVVVPGRENHTRLEGMKPDSIYFIEVRGYNSAGYGPPSQHLQIHTKKSPPSEAPGSVKGKALSATDASVWWLPLLQTNIDGYQVKYWRSQEEGEAGAQRVVVPGRENHTRLEGMKPDSIYFIEVRGYNSAGYGPPSQHLQIHTKKSPPSRPPKILSKKFKGQIVNIAWEEVEPLDSEASIDGYKVLYRHQGHSTLYTTSRRSIDLPLPKAGNFVVEVRAHSEGGDGAVAQIHLTGGGAMAARSLGGLSLLLVALLCLTL